MAKSVEPLNLEEIHETLANIFEQAQQSLANHKKNCVALYKLHQRASTVTKANVKKNGTTSTKLVGEKAFADAFLDMVNRVLVLKKGPPAADRIVKFVGSYVQYLNEKAIQDQEKPSTSVEESDDTMTSRFIARILSWLLQGFSAKNKNVRFRCLHIVSELISHIGEVDEDTYSLLREGLIERLNDKETLIRAHAAAALSKLVGSEDPDEIEEGEQSVLDILLQVLASDPAAEVRRAALLNVPLAPTTIDTVLKRTRDADPTTRKIMYTAVLPKLGHPRQLNLVQREQVTKDGLGDREPGVRVAAGKLLTKWFDIVLSEAEPSNGPEEDSTWVGDDAGVMKGFIRFLSLFDVIGSGEAIAVDTVTSIFVTRPDIPDAFIFADTFWRNLTPESAVLARVFVEHCIKTSNETRLEAASLPVVTAFAFHIQEAYNRLLDVLQRIENARLVRAGLEPDAEEEELEEDLAKREVILAELLRMALKLDYMDEIGRRKVFSVVKDMLAHPNLPPALIERCVDVLKEIMPSERDLIRVIVEIIVELREGDEIEDAENMLENLDDPDQSNVTENISRASRSLRKPKDRGGMNTEEQRSADLTDIRCLMLCIAMLERVNGSFEDNSTLEGILADLIIPSVKRKELAMREKALVSLGLCCLIAKNMALRSFQLFLGQVENAPTELKVQVLRVILDLLIMYDQEFFKNSEGIAQQITNFLIQTLQNEESPQAQAVLCTGICKLLLAGIITDPEVLVSLTLLYISPTTADNQELRQCLSYFFPVYSYASFTNQSRVQSVFLSAYDHAVRLHDDLEDEQQMVAPYEFGLMFVEWTDPTKAAQAAQAEISETHNAHAELAVQILTALYDEERSDDDRKTFSQILTQLQLTPVLDARSIHKLDLLISNQEQQSPFENAAIEKIFARFKARFYQLFEVRLKEINALDYVDGDEIKKIYADIAISPPKKGNAPPPAENEEAPKGSETSDHEEPENEPTSEQPPSDRSPARTSNPKRTSRSRAAKANHGKYPSPAPEEPQSTVSAEEPRPSTPPPKAKKGVKRIRTPTAARDDDGRKRTRRVRPRSSAAEEDQSEVERPATPTKAKTRAKANGAKAKAKPGAGRQTRTSGRNAKRKGEDVDVAPDTDEEEEGENKEEENTSTKRSTKKKTKTNAALENAQNSDESALSEIESPAEE